MRRWLLALFALQFFCSVSAFTYADALPLESRHHAVEGMIEVSKASLDMPLQGAMSALDAEHGLLDKIPELPELPEGLDVMIGATAAAVPWEVPRDRVITAWTPPALDGPQRPPRRLLALA